MAQDLPQFFGRYELVERLGVGGMAEVFRARMHTTGGSITKTVVLKKILKAYADDRGFIDMFRDEAKVALRLTHANVVQVFDFGEQDGEWFLVMEYVRGRNLRELLRGLTAKGALGLPAPLALHIGAEIAKGLHHAHTRKDDAGVPLSIVHRDVSPHNVLVSFEGDVKIADFGIAKARDRSAEKTAIGMLKGKLAYMAPELLHGHEATARSDVWALGATIWEMLTGRRLLESPSDSALIAELRSPDPFPPPSAVAKAPPEADRIVGRALEKDPARRFESALDLSRELVGVASADGSGDLAFAMAFAFENGPAPRWLPVPVSEDVTARNETTEPRRGVVPSVASAEPTGPSRRPQEMLELEMPLEAPRQSNVIYGHYVDAKTYLHENYQVQDGKRCMFLATDEKEIVVGSTLLVTLTFERPVARFRLAVKVLVKRLREETNRRGVKLPVGVLVEFHDGDTQDLYEYLGLLDK